MLQVFCKYAAQKNSFGNLTQVKETTCLFCLLQFLFQLCAILLLCVSYLLFFCYDQDNESLTFLCPPLRHLQNLCKQNAPNNYILCQLSCPKHPSKGYQILYLLQTRILYAIFDSAFHRFYETAKSYPGFAPFG